MTASSYVSLLTTRYGVTFGIAKTRLVFVSEQPLPESVRVALRQFAALVLTFLATGMDADLTAEMNRRELEDLGLLRLKNGRFTHPEGDDAALDILAGVVTPEQAREDALARRVDPHRLPPKVKVQAVEVHSGFYKWTEPKGARAVPVINGRPLFTE